MADEAKGAEAMEGVEVLDKEVAAAFAEDKALTAPMNFMQSVFRLSVDSAYSGDKDALKAEVMAGIEKDGKLPLYKALCEKHGWAVDEELVAKLSAKNDEDVKKADEVIAEKESKHGDVDVVEAQIARAQLLTRQGYKQEALDAYAAIDPDTISHNQKIDVAMQEARIAIMHRDVPLMKKKIEEAKKLNDKGGDWDRRNRLKVFEGIYCMCSRDFKAATELFIESLATFTCYEMCDYNTLVFYTIVCAVLTLQRTELKRKVIASPDVLSVLLELGRVGSFLNSLYECKYADFFQAVVDVYPQLASDRYLAPHAPFILRELRVKAYTQFLQAYRSITIEAMARSFGVRPPFLDKELARFISVGRLHARIDMISGVIETNRVDRKNQEYQDVLKTGDALLNRLQRLSRISRV